jgi:hypothetical protein
MLPADEGLNIHSEFLSDWTRIMNETRVTLMVKYFQSGPQSQIIRLARYNIATRELGIVLVP